MKDFIDAAFWFTAGAVSMFFIVLLIGKYYTP